LNYLQLRGCKIRNSSWVEQDFLNKLYLFLFVH